MISVTTRAGAAAAARRPPLIAERCLRTQFIWVMSAPERSSARLISCLWASVSPGAGRARRAEPSPESLDHVQHALGGRAAGFVGDRVRRLHHLDGLTGRRVAVAGHHQALERPVPIGLDRLGHGRSRLAGTDHQGAPLGRGRQVGRHRQLGVGGAECRLEKLAQQGGGV
jgi:hypothetical protein